MGLLAFLFGKQTDIFNEKGKVEHSLDKQKKEAWHNRFKNNPDYDWRTHRGKQSTKSEDQKSDNQKAD